MRYRWEATTVEGFVQQVAVGYLPNGFRYYVSGIIREGKDPRVIDARIVEKYQLADDKFERYRRKKRSIVNLHYIRFRRRFLILATGPVGKHRFFESEVEIRDARTVPIRFSGYELSYRGGKVLVRIDREDMKGISAYLLDVAVKRRFATLVGEFRALPYEPYRGVRYQLLTLLDEVNRRRKSAKLPSIPPSAVRFYRTPVRPFDAVEGEPRELLLGTGPSEPSDRQMEG